MTKSVLMPLPDRDFDVTEVAVPWRLLTDAGYTVVFSTERGQPAVADPLLLTGVIFGTLGADAQPKQFYAAMVRSSAFLNPIAWSAIVPEQYDALWLPGGHAPGMRQYLGSALLQQKVAEFWRLQRPVAAICHGVLVLARARDLRTGASLLATTQTTCLPKYMERLAYWLTAWKLGRYYRTYPTYVEDEVKAALADPAQFRRGPLTLGARGTATDDSPAFVVRDDTYLSARWPGDAYLLAKSLMQCCGVAKVHSP